MALILSLETSTDICSVAIHHDGELLSDITIREPQAHAARLAPLIHQLLRETGRSPRDLQAIAISSGPGSYTGLRIGTSTAKGLCFALGIPLIAVPTLQLLAFDFIRRSEIDGFLCPMIDARRMEVYCAVYDNRLHTISDTAAIIVDEKSFSELLDSHKMFFFGNGASKCRNVVSHSNAFFVDDVLPSATSLGIRAQQKFLSNQFEDLNLFAPFYLKEFVAKTAKSLF